MGLRSRFARWLNGGALPAELPATSAAIPSNADLLSRIEKLELERPAFVLELESLLETAQDILGRAESQRGRIAAAESRRKKKAEQPELDQVALEPNDRETVKAQVRALLRAQGKQVH